MIALGLFAADALEVRLELVDRIDWPEGFCRRDIGWQAVKREEGR